jgi:DNA-binding NarL/FixJ family response regulator
MLASFSGVQVAATAATPLAAMRWLRHNRCDLVLLDLVLQQGSGFVLLDAISRSAVAEPCAPPLRVVLTNSANQVVRRECRRLGAHAVFDKSTQLDEFFAFLRLSHATVH